MCDTIVLNKVPYALSGLVGYVSQVLKDRIDASFRKAYRWKLTDKQYKFDDLLSEVDSKLFACRKVESHCLHHMLPPRRVCSQMALHRRGHCYDVPRLVDESTKRSFVVQSLYRNKSVILQLPLSLVTLVT